MKVLKNRVNKTCKWQEETQRTLLLDADSGTAY